MRVPLAPSPFARQDSVGTQMDGSGWPPKLGFPSFAFKGLQVTLQHRDVIMDLLWVRAGPFGNVFDETVMLWMERTYGRLVVTVQQVLANTIHVHVVHLVV